MDYDNSCTKSTFRIFQVKDAAMNIGITGLSASGKSTIIEAFLGRANTPGSSKGALGVVSVPDERLDLLSNLYKPEKTTYSLVNFEDCFSLDAPSRQDRVKLFERLRVMDALLFVVGAFRCPASEDVLKEAMKIRFEIVVNDFDFVTKRMERLEKEMKSSAKFRNEKEAEMALLRRMIPLLEEERFLANLETGEQEKRLMAGYSLLTTRPSCYLLNVSEDAGAEDVAETLEKNLRQVGDLSPVLTLRGRLEAEIASMEPAEAQEFMKEYGISQSGRDRVLKTAFEQLDLITFFTVGEDECRAWNIRRGGSALDAASAIHSDLARGFIRAEVIEHDVLLSLGSLAEARKAGKLRLEGKTYLVKDGEMVHIMFNV